MKCDVAAFIAENQSAHLLNRSIAAVSLDEAIVTGAHDFHDKQDEHFSLRTKPAPDAIEPAKAECGCDKCAADSPQATAK